MFVGIERLIRADQKFVPLIIASVPGREQDSGIAFGAIRP